MASKRKTKGAPAIVPRFLKTAVTIGSIPALAAACAKPIQRQPPVVAYFAPPPPPVVAALVAPPAVVAAYIPRDAAIPAPKKKPKRP